MKPDVKESFDSDLVRRHPHHVRSIGPQVQDTLRTMLYAKVLTGSRLVLSHPPHA